MKVKHIAALAEIVKGEGHSKKHILSVITNKKFTLN